MTGSFARATGMSINRILGRKYDIINPRKKDWALVKGSFTVNKAIISNPAIHRPVASIRI